MEVVNEVMPTSRERIEQMMEPGPDGPIFMVNLPCPHPTSGALPPFIERPASPAS